MIDNTKLLDQLTALTAIMANVAKSLGEISDSVALQCDIAEASARIQPLEIVTLVANFYRMDRAQLQSHRRNRALVRKRQMAMVLCKQFTKLSLPEIGELFERDHTTVIHALDHWPVYLRHEPDLLNDFEKISEYLAKQAAQRAGACQHA